MNCGSCGAVCQPNATCVGGHCTETLIIDGGSATGQLPYPSTSESYFSFTGTAGQAVAILASAKPAADPFSALYIDTVVTLFDATWLQIAQNDDAVPQTTNDSRLYTMLPMNGTYYVRVADCNLGLPGICSDPSSITNFDFTVQVVSLSSLTATKEGPEPSNDTPPGATIGYTPISPGIYDTSIVYGAFQSNADTDVFTFSLPVDTAVVPGMRAVGAFNIMRAGANGTGATVDPGLVSIVDPQNPLKYLAKIDGALTSTLDPPLQLGKTYQLVITHPGGGAGTNDFYVVVHNATYYLHELETEPNGGTATADTPQAQDYGGGIVYFLVEGDITTPGAIAPPADHDYFRFSPVGFSSALVACGARMDGSGLSTLTISLLDQVGIPIPGATITEGLNGYAVLNVPIPANSSSLYLKTHASGQDPMILSTFYRCVVYLLP
jgi:hypothetical protein